MLREECIPLCSVAGNLAIDGSKINRLALVMMAVAAVIGSMHWVLQSVLHIQLYCMARVTIEREVLR